MKVKVLLQCPHCPSNKMTWEELEERKETPSDSMNPFTYGTGKWEIYPSIASLEYERYGCDECRQKSPK
jgi:hypothetical protein